MDRPDPYAWSAHPDALLGVAILVAAYVVAARRYPPERWRAGCFAGGCALLVLVAVTPLDPLSFHLLTAHLLQNVVLAEWAPALLVLGVSPALAARLSQPQPLKLLTRPAVALAVWIATYFVWHLPPAYDTALEHPSTLLHLEHASYVAAGVLLWWPIFHDVPHALSSAGRALYVFAAFVLASPLGLLLALLPNPVYDYYADADRLWGLGRIDDQQLAGMTMAGEQAIVFFVAFAFFFFKFLAEEDEVRGRAETPRADRPSGAR
ncbi:MAG: cytochrome c oxidase assembly protein [Actinomycetota bacterium]|nr:cytochrome c oxidase assembly protein [Actinomycetota bacterium]